MASARHVGAAGAQARGDDDAVSKEVSLLLFYHLWLVVPFWRDLQMAYKDSARTSPFLSMDGAVVTAWLGDLARLWTAQFTNWLCHLLRGGRQHAPIMMPGGRGARDLPRARYSRGSCATAGLTRST